MFGLQHLCVSFALTSFLHSPWSCNWYCRLLLPRLGRRCFVAGCFTLWQKSENCTLFWRYTYWYLVWDVYRFCRSPRNISRCDGRRHRRWHILEGPLLVFFCHYKMTLVAIMRRRLEACCQRSVRYQKQIKRALIITVQVVLWSRYGWVSIWERSDQGVPWIYLFRSMSVRKVSSI